jgi:hypothetical protein
MPMLYLNPPFNIINGVSLFRDHADPLQYYYLPIAPHLTVLKDDASKKRIPQIEVIKYRGRAGNGGFLSFDVNLGVEQSVLDDIKVELKRADKLSAQPRLAPVDVIDGTVKMMLLGSESGNTPAPDAAGPAPDAAGPKFVLKISHPAKPALYGDNQAAFSVQLDQEGITVLEKALQGEMSPIGIVYSLDYLALRPAYSVRLNVDWDRVQKHMDEHFGASVFFSSVDIDKAVDELVDKRVIVLEADTFVPEGEDSSGVIGRRDQALNEVRDMITNAFFEPSLNPAPAQDGWDKAAFVAQRVASIATTGGWGAVASFSYKKTDYKRIDKKILNVTMNERTTVKRSIYPQGHLAGLFRILKQENLDPAAFIIPVDLDDKWFERRRVQVTTGANFEEDAIGSINVNLSYANEPKNVILTATGATKSLDWGSVITQNAMQWDVPYSYRITFKGVDSTERPLTLASPARQVSVENLEVNPRELYSIVPIPILALTPPFPWKRFPNVEVQTKYTDAANKIRINDSFLLSEATKEQTWKLFIMDPQLKQFQYKLIYRAANNKDITLPWVTSEEEQIIVRDPYPQKRTLRVVPLFNWQLTERAFVDVSYNDKTNRVSESQSFEFTENDNYSVTVLFKDGHMVEVPPSFTRQDRVIVRSDMKGHKIVLVRPVTDDFAKKKAKKVTVELRYQDGPNGLSFSDNFDFDEKNLNGLAYFEYDYADKPAYDYRATVRFLNGLSKVTDWQKSSVDELVVPIN